jgi:hypothetical protein
MNCRHQLTAGIPNRKKIFQKEIQDGSTAAFGEASRHDTA